MAPKTKKAPAKAADVKTVKHADIRGKTPDELKDQLLGLKKEQFNLRFQRATQQLEKPARVRDASVGYNGYKDVNEFVVARLIAARAE